MEEDQTSTTDTSTQDAVDTSTNDDAQVTDTDVDLEDIEVTEEEALGDETEESESEDESQASEESEDEESEEDEASDDTGNTESNDSDESQSDEAQTDSDDSKDTEDDVKKRNDEYAKKRIAEREAREREREIALVREDEQLKQYLNEAKDDEAEYALRQAQVERRLNQRERVSLNQDRLETGIDKAVASIDLFRNGNDVVKQELAQAVEDFVALNVVTDEFGDPVEVRGDIYEFLQKKADSIRRIQGVGARQEVKNRSKAKARTMQTPVRTPKPPKVDQDLADFESGWD